MGIKVNRKDVSAELIFSKLDAMDGTDGKITKSIWDKFRSKIKTGATINYSISKDNAIKSINSYLQKIDDKTFQEMCEFLEIKSTAKPEESKKKEEEKPGFWQRAKNTVVGAYNKAKNFITGENNTQRKTENKPTYQESVKSDGSVVYTNDKGEQAAKTKSGNFKAHAKYGESFNDTMLRLGITDPKDQKAFIDANPNSYKRGYFSVTRDANAQYGDVFIPKAIADKLDINNILVNRKTELEKYSNSKTTPSTEQKKTPTETTVLPAPIGSSSADSTVEGLIHEIYKTFGKADLENLVMKNINTDNVVEVLEKYEAAANKKNLVDKETLFEAILDENISEEKKKKYIKHITDALIQKVRNYGGAAVETAALLEQAIDRIFRHFWPFQNSKDIDKLAKVCIDFIKETQPFMNAADKVKAKSANLNKYIISMLRSMGLSTDDLWGNGELDNDSVQQAGNCWIHACLNSLASTEKGRAYARSLIRKTPDGKTIVFLPGAKKDGIPADNPGYFVFTQADIARGMRTESAGDGDYTAINLAMTKYLKATTKGYTNNSGGWMFLFEEAVFGNCHFKFVTSYKQLKEIFDSKKCIIYVSVKSIYYGNNLHIVGGNDTDHAITVVKMDGDRAWLQDSNNPGKLIPIDADTLMRKAEIEYAEIPDPITEMIA